MKRTLLFRGMSLLITMVLLLSVGGVYATWHYAREQCTPVQAVLPLEIFPWQGSEVLPEDDQVGKNHKNLIEIILNGSLTNSNGTVTPLGLNYADSYLNSEIEDRAEGSWWATSDTLGSMDFWESADINNYFNTSNENISFVLYFPDGVADTYYLYTTDVELESGNNPNISIGEPIYPIYQTVLTKNAQGVWEATDTKVGYAESDWYDNRITGSLLRYPSFDPATWVEGELGTTQNTAIWAYKGQTSTIQPTDKNAPVYYRLQSDTDASYTVYSAATAVKITVTDKNGKAVAVTDGAQDSNRVVFTAKAGTLYYVILSGADTITFNIV